MKYRWKLLLLLLLVGIVPLVGMRTFGIHQVRLMGDRLIAAHQNRGDHAEPSSQGVCCPTVDVTRETIQNQVGQIEDLTAGVLVLLIAAAAAAAFLFSQTVTRPLEKLARAARELAGGRFDARVDIQSRDEFGEMGRVFNKVGPALSAHLKVSRALAIADEVQKNLLPEKPPRVRGLDIGGQSIYCQQTGGDYFDYLCQDEGDQGRVCVVVGDVADHGVPASLVMATARAFLRLRSALGGTLSEIVTDVNRQFSRDVGQAGMFMTLVLARFDTRAGTLSTVRAGHEPALLFDPGTGEFETAQGEGPALGLSADVRFQETKIPLRAGRIVVLATDGVWEAEDPEGRPFGRERMREVIMRNADQDADAITRAVTRAVTDHVDAATLQDDVTVVTVKVLAVGSTS